MYGCRVNHVASTAPPLQESIVGWNRDGDLREKVLVRWKELHRTPAPADAPDEREDAAEAQAFIDFTPLLNGGKRMNESSRARSPFGSIHLAFCDNTGQCATDLSHSAWKSVNGARHVPRCRMLVISPSAYFGAQQDGRRIRRRLQSTGALIRARRGSHLQNVDAVPCIPARLSALAR